ncbi:hypothetical protein VDG1235_4432 [Verrucomicrobiia bacterium DG1235]|nr:hypothetical protein VDG1235_4432 [Verrucomicrobiae bacterium DG1235]
MGEEGAALELSFRGAIEIGDFAFERGFPVSVQVYGPGEVEGVPASGVIEAGEVLALSAIPDEGWEFHRWTGAVDSTNPDLSLSAREGIELVAEFARVVTVGDFDVALLGADFWSVSEGPNGDYLKVESVVPAGEALRATIEVVGPGKLSFNYGSLAGYGKIYLDGEVVADVQPVSIYDILFLDTELVLDVGVGVHELEVRLSSSMYIDKEFDFYAGNFKLDRRVDVNLSTSAGGSVAGRPDSALVAYGAELKLEAVPETGYRFLGWVGDVESENPEVNLTALRDLSLEAIFVALPDEVEVEEDRYIDRLIGNGFWKKVDGAWESPEALGVGEFSAMEGTVKGPSYLVLEFDEGNSGSLGDYVVSIGGEPIRSSGSNGYFVKEGEHLFRITANPDSRGRYESKRISDLRVEYQLEVKALDAEIAWTPELGKLTFFDGYTEFGWWRETLLGWWDETFLYRWKYFSEKRSKLPSTWIGYFEEGEEISYEVVAEEGMEFVRWEGDLEGSLSSGIFIIEGPISAEVITAFSDFEIDGVTWTVEGGEGLSRAPDEDVEDVWVIVDGELQMRESDLPGVFELNGRTEEVVFSANLNTAGWLGLSLSYPGIYELWIDGELETSSAQLAPSIWHLIPDGEHEVSVVLRARGNESALIGGEWPAARLTQFEFKSGFQLQVPSFEVGGGEVVVSPLKDMYEKGDVVEVTAVPDEGNEFVEWIEKFAGEEESFSLTVEDHTRLIPRFRALDNIAGYDWEFSGITPTYDASSGNGRFRWGFSSVIEQASLIEVSMRFEGAGILVVPEVSFGYGGNFEYIAYLDGEVLTSGYEEDGEVRVEVGEGEHVLNWEILVLSGFYYPYLLQSIGVDVPELLTEFEVSASVGGEAAEIAPLKDSYRLGESVRLSVPEIDEHGQSFNGWWSEPNGTGVLVSMEAAWDIRIAEDVEVYADYTDNPIRIEGASVAFRYTPNIELDPEVLTPRGNASWEATGHTTFFITVAEASAVRFSSYVTGHHNSQVRIRRGDEEVFGAARASEQWMRRSVFLDAGESLEVRCDVYSDSDVRVGDFEVTKGWGPTLSHPEGVAIEESLSDSESEYSLTMVDESPFSFGRWSFADGSELYDRRIDVPVGSTEAVRLFVESEHDSSIGKISMLPSDAYGVGSDFSGEDGVVRWESVLGYDGFLSSALAVELEGPVSLAYSAYGGTGESTALEFLDGELVGRFDVSSSYSARERILNIPSGIHEVMISHSGAEPREVTVTSLRIRDGLSFADQDFGTGRVAVSPVRESCLIGEEISFVAIPDAGYEFVSWKGVFNEKPRRFTVLVGDGLNAPEPVFRKRTVEGVSAFGLDWEVEGMSLSPMSELLDDYVVTSYLRSHVSGVPSRMSASLDGPCVLRVGAEMELDTVEVDGVKIPDLAYAYRFRDADLYLGIPEGKHELTVHFSRNERNGELSDAFSVLRGYLVDLRSAGIGVKASPDLLAYPPGTEIVAEALGGFEEENLEWLGLPSNAILAGKQAIWRVNEHVVSNALYWSNVHLLGKDARHAGDDIWKLDVYSNIEREGFAAGEVDVLEFSGFEAGILKLKFDRSSSAAVDFRHEVWFNGERVSLKNNETGDYEAFVRIESQEDVVRWVIREESFNFEGSHSGVEFVELSHLSTHADKSYLGWWNRYSGEDVFDRGIMDAELDLDGDGLSNYFEFLLGLDPWKSAAVMEMSLSKDTNKFMVRTVRIPSEVESQFEIEYWDKAEGWKNAEVLFSEPEIGDIDLEHVVRTVEYEFDSGRALLVRMKLLGYTPSLEYLLRN